MGVLTATAERRTAPRHSPDQLPGITSVKVSAEQVAVINASRSGILVEGPVRLNPGSEHAVEIVADGAPLRRRGRVVRCQIKNLSAKGPRYEIAIAFTTPLDALDQEEALHAAPMILSEGFEIYDVPIGEPDPAFAANSW